jgi:hypothetical protein
MPGDKRHRLSENEARKVFIRAGLEPLEPFVNTRQKWKSSCSRCGSIVNPRYSAIQQGQKGCRACFADSQRLSSIDVAATLKAEYLIIRSKYVNSKLPIEVMCIKCGTEFTTQMNRLRNRKDQCPNCFGRQTYKKGNRKIHVNLDEINEFLRIKNLRPIEPFPGVTRRWKCVHEKCGKEVSILLKGLRSSNGDGCKYCVRNRKLNGDQAISFMRTAGFEPLTDYKNVEQPWKSKCMVCLRIVSPRLADVKKGKKCGYCAKRKVDPREAIKIMKAQNLKPLEPYPGNKKGWKSLHVKCGNIVYPRFNSIQQDQGGCKFCMKTFKYDKPSYLYLIWHQELTAIKVGIGNYGNKKDRLKSHLANGWVEYRIYDFSDGRSAEKCETEVLKWIRKDRGLAKYLSPEFMPQGGHSETVDGSEISLGEVENQINLVMKQLRLF